MIRTAKSASKKTVAYPTLVEGIGALLEQSRRAVEILSTVSRESTERFSIWQTVSAESSNLAGTYILQTASAKLLNDKLTEVFQSFDRI